MPNIRDVIRAVLSKSAVNIIYTEVHTINIVNIFFRYEHVELNEAILECKKYPFIKKKHGTAILATPLETNHPISDLSENSGCICMVITNMHKTILK